MTIQQLPQEIYANRGAILSVSAYAKQGTRVKAITYIAARQKLAQLMAEVCANHCPVIITRQSGEPVVLMSLADYDSIQEIGYLLSSPANAERLRASVADAEQGKTTRKEVSDL